jgi:hypothetical protein
VRFLTFTVRPNLVFPVVCTPQTPYLFYLLSVRKVVPTLTSNER